jgi:hypothetical protein
MSLRGRPKPSPFSLVSRLVFSFSSAPNGPCATGLRRRVPPDRGGPGGEPDRPELCSRWRVAKVRGRAQVVTASRSDVTEVPLTSSCRALFAGRAHTVRSRGCECRRCAGEWPSKVRLFARATSGSRTAGRARARAHSGAPFPATNSSPRRDKRVAKATPARVQTGGPSGPVTC